MNDLIEFLRQCIDDDERVARAATAGPWWDSPVRAAPGHHTIRGGPGDFRGFDGSLGGDTRPIARIEPAPDFEGEFVTNHDADAAHIARWDPARVLAEVDAKRRILDACGLPEWWDQNGMGRIAEMLALPYADRLGYLDEWRPE